MERSAPTYRSFCRRLEQDKIIAEFDRTIELVNNWRSMLATDISSVDSRLVTEGIADIILLFLIFGIAISIWSFLWFLSKLSEMDREFKRLNAGRGWGKVRLDKFTISCSVHVVVAKWYLDFFGTTVERTARSGRVRRQGVFVRGS